MKRLAVILILWLPFSIASLLSIPILLWGLMSDDASIWRPVGRAMDKLLAALLGFSGNHTLSAELAMSARMQWLRKLLDSIEVDHCRKAAVSEGLIA